MDELPEDDVDDGEGKCVPEDADICSDDEDAGVMASDSRIMRAYALVSCDRSNDDTWLVDSLAGSVGACMFSLSSSCSEYVSANSFDCASVHAFARAESALSRADIGILAALRLSPHWTACQGGPCNASYKRPCQRPLFAPCHTQCYVSKIDVASTAVQCSGAGAKEWPIGATCFRATCD